VLLAQLLQVGSYIISSYFWNVGLYFSIWVLMLLTLMQRDYLKWRGTLFHRFLLALVDESEKIRQLADFLFSSILKSINVYQIYC
jgi:hypothetical protein